MRNKFMFSILLCSLLIAAFAFSSVTTPRVSAATTHVVSVASPLVTCPPTIQEGSSGSLVVSLQRELNELFQDFDDSRFWENSPDNAQPPLAVDGSFGPLTRNAVIDFQFWNPPLNVDGIVGPATWHVLGRC